MLKHAVEEMKAGKDSSQEEVSAEIQLPVEALLPTYYIPDEQEKISVYQKLAGSDDETLLKEFEDDLNEEFGPPPKPVLNLFAILRLKIACRRSGVIRIKMDNGTGAEDEKEIALTLSSSVTAKEIMQLLSKSTYWRISGSVVRIFKSKLIKGSATEDIDWLTTLTEHVATLQKKKGKGKK